MPKSDQLLIILLSNVGNLKNTPYVSDRFLSDYSKEKVDSLKELRFLSLAPLPKFIECPEEGCNHCMIAVQIENEDLFGYCSEYEDIARIPLKTEDVRQFQLNISEIAKQLSDTLGSTPLNREEDNSFDVCYLNGHLLSISAGSPVVLRIEQQVLPLADAMCWSGSRYCFQVDRIRKLIPAQKGGAESPFERRCRYLSKFMELRKWNKTVGERQKRMAEEFDESQQNVRRVLADALKDSAVHEFLKLPKRAKLELKSL